MADPRAQEVLSGDCGPIHSQHTLTTVPPIRRRLSLNRKGVLKMAATSDGFPLKGKLPPVGGKSLKISTRGHVVHMGLTT